MNLLQRAKNIDEHWKALIFSILIVLFGGILPAILTKDWSFLSRSGSLLVVYGVYIVWLDYRNKIESAYNEIAKAFNEKHGGVPEELSLFLENAKVKNRQLYQNMEFLIIGVGTIIWGYGDIAGRFFS